MSSYIIFSPSKSHLDNLPTTVKNQQPKYINQSKILQEKLMQYNHEDLKELYSSSDTVALKAKTYIDNFTSPKHHIPAIASFSGNAFKQLEFDTLEGDAQLWLENHLYILSAMYGSLRPQDTIHPYRLDMNDKIFSNKSLYDFWSTFLCEEFKEGDIIINCASKEYSDMVPKNAQSDMITVTFKIQKNGALKSNSVFSKKMRGQCVRYLAKNKSLKVNKLKEFSYEGCVFSSEYSSEKELVFIKPDMS